MWKWLEDIRTLYRLNTARLAVWDATVPLEHQAAAFVARHGDLTTHLSAMQVRCEMYRRERRLHLSSTKMKTPISMSIRLLTWQRKRSSAWKRPLENAVMRRCLTRACLLSAPSATDDVEA
jgi:hypothetical protein